jgi:DnaJ family protein C protein 7
MNKALCHAKLLKNDAALEDLSKAIECNPDYSKAYMKRGEINTIIEDFEEAVRDYANVERISPGQFGVKKILNEAKIKLKASKRKDYYKILNISKDADASDIKKAYRKLALVWHPDKNSGDTAQMTKAEKMFKDIGEAYAILSDPEKRQRYDSGVDIEDIENGHSHGHGFSSGGVDPTQIFQMFFGGGGMGGGMDSGFGQRQQKRASPGGGQYEFRFG